MLRRTASCVEYPEDFDCLAGYAIRYDAARVGGDQFARARHVASAAEARLLGKLRYGADFALTTSRAATTSSAAMYAASSSRLPKALRNHLTRIHFPLFGQRSTSLSLAKSPASASCSDAWISPTCHSLYPMYARMASAARSDLLRCVSPRPDARGGP